MAERLFAQLLRQRPSQQAAAEVAASCGASAALPGQVAVCGGRQLLLLLLLHRLLRIRPLGSASCPAEKLLISLTLQFDYVHTLRSLF